MPHPDIDNLPKDVQSDLDQGFVLTDIDDAYQRCKVLSDTQFEMRSGTDDVAFLCSVEPDFRAKVECLVEEVVDIDTIDAEDAVSGFYDSVVEIYDQCDMLSANMIIAECYFETHIDSHRS
jgi:hypothetical protein